MEITLYIRALAQSQPDKPAAIRPTTGEIRTFREIENRSNQLAQLLNAHGLQRGDHVAVYLENHLVYFDVVAACMRSGLYLTPINSHLPASQAAYIVENCDASALIASSLLPESEELGRLSEKCRIKLSVGDALPGFEEFDAAIAGYPIEPLQEEWLGTFMLYSSGTTGKPKGIKRALTDARPHGGNPGMASTGRMFAMGSDTVYLCPAPLYHSAPIGYTCAAIQAGGTAVVMDRFEPELALQLIEAYGVTHSMWVPTMFVRMLKLDEQVRKRYDLSSLRCAIHSAAPCPVEVKRQMIAWWGPIIDEFYSSTEMAGFARINSNEWLERPGSVGRSQGLPFHICDEHGVELPPGEPGTIYSEMPTVTRFTYYKDEGKTVGSVHSKQPNWMTVGDVGTLDADGYLFLTDRKAFMIISGGVNIYPQQIEDILALHAKVADVAVIGVPNEDLGEEIKAVVQAAQDATPSDALAEEIREFVREKLGKQLTPRTVDFVEALPRLPTGKLYKKALRDQYWPAAERR